MHRATITTTRLINWLKAGRGQGVGKEYSPWLQVTRQDHASIGQSHILPNPFIGRQHHLLSNLERATCVLGMAQPYVTDIREQFPLWPFPHPNPLFELLDGRGLAYSPAQSRESDGTVELAKGMSIRHARFIGLGVPYIYTTDLLFTIELPGHQPFLVAISIKYWSDLRGSNPPQKSKDGKRKKARRNKFRKLRLEREYWRHLGIPWILVTDRLIHQQVYRNLEWALSGTIQRIKDEDVALLRRFLWAWNSAEWRGRCVDQMEAIGQALQVNTATAIRLLKFAILRALVPVDLTQSVHLQLPFPHGSPRSPMEIPTWSYLKSLRKLP